MVPTKDDLQGYFKTDEGWQYLKDNFQEHALELPEEECMDLLDTMLMKDF